MKADKMTEQFDRMKYIKELQQKDPRRKAPQVSTEIIANNEGLNFERLAKIIRGTTELHMVDILGQPVPMRVLSGMEEIECEHQARIDMKKFPEFMPGTIDYDTVFRKIWLRKMISLSTSTASKSVCGSGINYERFYTEEDLWAVPNVTFATFINAYKDFESMYNPSIADVSEERAQSLFKELRGIEDPEKKSLFMISMTSWELIAVLKIFLGIEIEREDNIQLSTYLEDLEMTKVTELP